MAAQGTLFIVSAPSGAGKSSLITALLKRFNYDDKLRLSISHTTRDMRPGEENGKSYYFITNEEFEALIARQAFFGFSKVFVHYYGTSREIIDQWLAEGRDVLLDIDWQGARSIRAQAPDAVGIFILPPSLTELRSRLERRGRDSAADIDSRMDKAQREISHYNEYDYILVNDVFDETLLNLRSIILAKRQERARQEQAQRELIAELLPSGSVQD